MFYNGARKSIEDTSALNCKTCQITAATEVKSLGNGIATESSCMFKGGRNRKRGKG